MKKETKKNLKSITKDVTKFGTRCCILSVPAVCGSAVITALTKNKMLTAIGACIIGLGAGSITLAVDNYMEDEGIYDEIADSVTSFIPEDHETM